MPQIVPALITGSSFGSAPMSFKPVTPFLKYFLSFWHQKIPGSTFIYPDLALNQLPLQRACFFLLENGNWKPKILVLDMVIAIRCLLLLDLGGNFNRLESKIVCPFDPAILLEIHPIEALA